MEVGRGIAWSKQEQVASMVFGVIYWKLLQQSNVE